MKAKKTFARRCSHIWTCRIKYILIIAFVQTRYMWDSLSPTSYRSLTVPKPYAISNPSLYSDKSLLAMVIYLVRSHLFLITLNSDGINVWIYVYAYWVHQILWDFPGMMILSVQSLFRVLTRICLLVLDEINDILFYSILFHSMITLIESMLIWASCLGPTEMKICLLKSYAVAKLWQMRGTNERSS